LATLKQQQDHEFRLKQLEADNQRQVFFMEHVKSLQDSESERTVLMNKTMDMLQ